tara:strand:- start:864 stop:2765 length:1902 start_codon:yes stop_codon:yes gene_type:complete
MADDQLKKLETKNAKTLDKVLKNLEKNRGKGQDVSGESFNRSNVNKMGAMTRSQSGKFVPETKGVLGALGGAASEKAGEIKSNIIGRIAGAGYVAKRLNVGAAKRKQKKLRDNIQKMYEAAFARNEPGATKFTTSVLGALKGSEDADQGFIDVLIQLGATTPDEMDSLFRTFGSGEFDQATLDNVIESKAQDAGLSTTSGKFGLGLKSSGLGSMGSGGGGGGSDLSPFTGGPITGQVVPQELEKQTKLLQSIEKLLKPDKLQTKEDKLEKDRDKKQSGLMNRAVAVSSNSNEEEEGGGFLSGLLTSIMGTVMARMGLSGLTPGSKPPKPPKPPKPIKPVKPTRASGLSTVRKIVPKKVLDLAAKGGAAGAGALTAVKESKAVQKVVELASKVPALAAGGSKVAAIGGAVLKRGGPILAAAGSVYGAVVEGQAEYNRAVARGEEGLELAASTSLGVGLGGLDAFNPVKLLTSLLGDSKSDNAIVAGLGRADDYMSVKNQIEGAKAYVDPQFYATAGRGIGSALGLMSSQEELDFQSGPGNEDRRARNRRRALEAQAGGPAADAEAIAKAERIRAFKASQGGNSGNTVVAPTVNSGNTSTTNTTIQSQRVGQSESSAAMANAMARFGGFSSPRFA